MLSEQVLVVKSVSKTYRMTGNWWRGHQHAVPAVQNISLQIAYGEVYGLVGESGSGKSTLARLVAMLEHADTGNIQIDGVAVAGIQPSGMRALRRQIQMVFQDPYAALDPMQTVEEAIAEPLLNLLADIDEPSRTQRIAGLLQDVGLPGRLLHAYPHELSGGERQRVCIARALALHPKLLICDEPVSSLDKSVQAQILNLLAELQQRHKLASLFISHDLAVINHISTRVGVMLRGRLIEEGSRLQVLTNSAHPYTASLVAASAWFSKGRTPPQLPLSNGRIPERGCAFQDRCLFARARCYQEVPDLQTLGPGHRVACHLLNSGHRVACHFPLPRAAIS